VVLLRGIQVVVVLRVGGGNVVAMGLSGDVVVVRCGGGMAWRWWYWVATWWWICVVSICSAAEGLSAVGGWAGRCVGGDGVVGGGDGRLEGVMLIGVVRFLWLQVWQHIFHARLILLQQTPGSFVVVWIVVVGVCSRRWLWFCWTRFWCRNGLRMGVI